MRERKIMSSDGIVVVIANIDTNNNTIINNPNITTRGFVLIQDNLELLKEIEEFSKSIIEKELKKHTNFSEIKNKLTMELSIFIYEKTGRHPIISPLLVDIKKEAK